MALSPATAADVQVLREQLGRTPRGVEGIAARCVCGAPFVVATAPLINGREPFPTTFYLTHPVIVRAASRLEAEHVMDDLNTELGADPALAAAYARAHTDYLRRRAEVASAAGVTCPEQIATISAGGMPTRVKCLHALIGHALAAGPGNNPIGDRALEMTGLDLGRCICEAGAGGEAAAASDQTTPGRDEVRVAGVDCGTNSIRLLIADVRGTEAGLEMSDVVRTMEIVRLGQGVDQTGEFAPAALERTLEQVRKIAKRTQRAGVKALRFGATSATRDAANRDIFIDAVRTHLGVEPEVISGDEEARLSFGGALSSLEASSELTLVVDIGGGSTEFVIGRGTAVEAAISTDMGGVRLTERHFKAINEDPDRPGSITPGPALEGAIADIEALIDTADAALDLARVERIVGVAGTATTLAATALGLDRYDPDATHGHTFTIGEMVNNCNWMMEATIGQRRALPFMPPARADVIGAGALIWRQILARLHAHGLEQVTISEHDILDGLAISAAQRYWRGE